MVPLDGDTSADAGQQQQRGDKERDGITIAKIRTVKMTVTVVLCYLVCQTPYIVIQLLGTFWPEVLMSRPWVSVLSLNVRIDEYYWFFNDGHQHVVFFTVKRVRSYLQLLKAAVLIELLPSLKSTTNPWVSCVHWTLTPNGRYFCVPKSNLPL